MTKAALYIFSSSLLVVGCASSQKPEWNTAGVFSSGSVRAQDQPRDHWTQSEEELLLRRMGYADTVAVGTLRVLSQVNRSGVPRQLTMAFRPEEQLFGSLKEHLDGAGAILLRLDGRSEDFQRALRVQKELVGSRYLVFFQNEPRTKQLRWAFYRPSERLLTEVRARYRWLSKRPD